MDLCNNRAILWQHERKMFRYASCKEAVIWVKGGFTLHRVVSCREICRAQIGPITWLNLVSTTNLTDSTTNTMMFPRIYYIPRSWFYPTFELVATDLIVIIHEFKYYFDINWMKNSFMVSSGIMFWKFTTRHSAVWTHIKM